MKLRMTPRRVAILAQYREAFYGGDPDMSRVTIQDVLDFTAAGLTRPFMPWESHLLRHRTLTLEGWAALEKAEARKARKAEWFPEGLAAQDAIINAKGYQG